MRNMHVITRNSGYIFEQLLITLGICAFLIPIVCLAMHVMTQGLVSEKDLQDEMATAQLRHIINVSSDFQNNGNTLSFLYHDEPSSLELINRKVVQKSGTRIFLTDVDALSFQTDGIIRMIYERDGKETIRVIGHE